MAGSRAGAKSFKFPAFRAVEDDPHHKVVREIFEAVLDAGWHEQYVAGAEGMAIRPVDERPVSAYDHVHFVAGMRRLRVGAAGRVDLDLHAPVFEYLCEPLSSGSRQQPNRLSDRRPASPCSSDALVHLVSSFRIASPEVFLSLGPLLVDDAVVGGVAAFTATHEHVLAEDALELCR